MTMYFELLDFEISGIVYNNKSNLPLLQNGIKNDYYLPIIKSPKPAPTPRGHRS